MTVLCAALVAITLGVQEIKTVQPPPKTEQTKPDPGPSRYVLGPQDQLRITVFDEPDLTNSYRVEADGFMYLVVISTNGVMVRFKLIHDLSSDRRTQCV